MGDGVIGSSDDFKDERSQELFRTHRLNLDEILPFYEELRGVSELTIPGTRLALNSPLIKRLASGAIVSYELASNETVSFPVRRKVFGPIYRGGLGQIQRATSPQEYLRLGDHYSDMIRTLLNLHKS